VRKPRNEVVKISFGSVPVFRKRKAELPILTLSPHSIALFKQCRLQYKFCYIDKLREQYGRARPYYTAANHVHATLYDLFSLIPPWERSVETATRLLKKNWARYRVGFRNRADERRWAERALAEVTCFVQDQELSITPIMLEKPIEAKVTAGLVLHARVDRVDKQPDGTLHVIDYKTGKKPEEIDWTQLELDALILSRSTPYLVSKLSYWYLLPGKIESREFDKQTLERANWELLCIAKDIRKETEYPPNPGPACAGCDFSAICYAKHDGYVNMGETALPLWRDFSEILPNE
jgi:putative RecB family exonuclease